MLVSPADYFETKVFMTIGSHFEFQNSTKKIIRPHFFVHFNSIQSDDLCSML
jgi:hypothetical protein